MNFRRLGNAGIKLSEIGLGGWLTFGDVTGEESGRDLIETAFDCGINFFDTANVYASGACEHMWGRLLKGILTGKYKPGEPAPAGSRAGDERRQRSRTVVRSNLAHG